MAIELACGQYITLVIHTYKNTSFIHRETYYSDKKNVVKGNRRQAKYTTQIYLECPSQIQRSRLESMLNFNYNLSVYCIVYVCHGV